MPKVLFLHLPIIADPPRPRDARAAEDSRLRDTTLITYSAQLIIHRSSEKPGALSAARRLGIASRAMTKKVVKIDAPPLDKRKAWDQATLEQGVATTRVADGSTVEVPRALTEHLIQCFSEIPTKGLPMHITNLTFLAFSINGAVDTGRYDHITIGVVVKHIEAGTVFSYLQDELEEDLDLSMFDTATKDQLLEEWKGLLNAVDARRKFGVRRSGLCLLVAYLIEGVQRRL